MAYCHQCGEKVAENDIFCPYCGISLQPISIGGSQDMSFDKTIAVNQPTISESTENQNSEENARTAQNGENSYQQTDDFSGTAEDEHYLKTESVEIPAEVFESENLAHSASAGESAASTQPPTENSDEMSRPAFLRESEETPQVPLPENIEILKPLEEPPKSEFFEETLKPESSEEISTSESLESRPESEERENQVVHSEEIKMEGNDSAAEEIPAQPNQSFSEFENDSPDKNESAPAEEIGVSPEIPAAVEPDASEASTFLYESGSSPKNEFVPEPEAESQPESFSEESISKPEDELAPAPRRESVFDSVQIVQKEEIKERLDVRPAESQPDSSAEQATEQAENAPEQKEGRSYTTPNFTGNDTDGKSGSKLKPLDEGTILNNRYEIVRKIGGGGMGAVYLASDKNLGGVLRAVKEMVQSYIEETQQEKAVADFKRESMLLTSLEHPAIPTIFDYFYDEQEARFYLVMKYISGGDLASRLRSAPEGKIDEKTITEWAIQIADVLDYLHNHQPPIVYRDLKPANIMIDGNSGRIMLIDFGIARWINKEEKGVTAVGTMGYAPPELFSGNVDARSDIYSLGSTMFHLLTGADPQSNPLLIFDFQKNPRPRQINPQLSDQIERILMRSVEYNSDKRFSTAGDMRQALQEHLDNLKSRQVTFGVKEIPASVALSEQPVFCGFCGQKIVATDMFCAFCGAKQPIAQQGVHIGNYSGASLTAKLMIVGTNELDSPSFNLEKDENLVGRRDPMSNIFPEIDLSKFDPQTKISRRHARIWREGGQFMVEDLGSSNGTILLPVVSDTIRLLPHQPHVLADGDKLKVGDTTMHFVIG
ncbi:MAG TPA: protein kinase [Pyrinomonadaceae bacterium]|jgi:serine/threonine-protein kinase